ncbi:conjugal transfer protein TraF [Vibrio cholerae]|uniref:conjugal transfer protein TraF n=1 Tax=Vibrio cholerae TaxID=666 RepID=UPI00115B98C8|nr:conjugal transfer protein TraF [Vibrio cholerae]EGR0772785.1 type IX secretion system membrane protein PorP/SprF [Vibrio cholerae]EGR0777870.1 type IX secretion system membrane protein PorP/SprF [Vibrio cholerae]EGR0781903.1 type IX secretion system membrane protein PorP/SprF [Vibrio cholerae]EGR0821915.1 type IX secretion system membrane protein PorP/SprF [Vibrio cholerae]EGR0831507.1 type IX secretion system membrane protein PorP/SprF [Vibrio cholerae]
MNIQTKSTLAVVMAMAFSSSAFASNLLMDARGAGMGNTGVSTADYLLAPYYNPALTAVYRKNDSFGILLPSIGLRAEDKDESLKTIDDLQDSIEQFERAGVGAATQENVDQLNRYLDQLADDKPLAVTAGIGIAVALPLDAVSLNFFTRGYAEVIAKANVAAKSGNSANEVKIRYESSDVDLTAFGYTEVGLAVGKQVVLGGQTVALGVTPKVQQLRTYQDNASVKSFDLDDYDKSEVKDNAFNLDMGAVWLIDQYRVGIVAKDLFAKDIQTQNRNNTYKLDTQIAVSGSYVSDFFIAAVDLDLTKQRRFNGDNDDTQFMRFGVEGNVWGWAQLRAGYEVDLQNSLDNSVSVGLGVSPWDVVSFDLAGSYAGDNQFGLSANLAFTF